MKEYNSIHFTHEVVMYVPCYQINPGMVGRFNTTISTSYPSFEYSMGEASTDLSTVTLDNPDYILVLKGQFNAKTQPFDEKISEFNRGESK